MWKATNRQVDEINDDDDVSKTNQSYTGLYDETKSIELLISLTFNSYSDYLIEKIEWTSLDYIHTSKKPRKKKTNDKQKVLKN